uniref:Uncharacterized protein n=1 Tax=Anguilla anguilla TaxID=7936 RepID=A0A0E9WSW5_ANGAN
MIQSCNSYIYITFISTMMANNTFLCLVSILKLKKLKQTFSLNSKTKMCPKTQIYANKLFLLGKTMYF